MEKIKRVADVSEGPPDGVTAETQCVVTRFGHAKEKGSIKNGSKVAIKSQAVAQCNIACAYSEGTIAFSVREINQMYTIRIDELYEILKAAAEASREFTASMPKEYKDAELEAQWRELEDAPFDESDESPSGLILAEKWREFPKGTDREDIWRWFDDRHSKGVAYLIHGGAEEG
jgi:hypothetical protein